jgi:hypothetical protein
MWRRTLRVSEALFYSILRGIVMLFRRRAEDALKAFDGLPEPPPVEHVGDLLTPLMWQARKQAWAAAALFLRGQARKAGAPESWIPPQPGYSPKTIARTIRGTQGALSSPEGMRRLERTLEGHVLAAARRTVADAVDTAPSSIELVEGALDDLAKDLEEFSENAQKAIVEDVEKVEARRRPRMSLEEAFEKVADRIEEAVRTLDEEELVKERHRSMKVFSEVPDKYRRNSRGELIARPFAFARVTHPNKNGPCGFCAMLASRGPVYKSSESAGLRVDKFHANCVVGDTKVSGPDVKVGYRRYYEGEIVTLVTAGGHELTITPNHPVLTDRGWVNAGDLQEGDNLVSGTFGNGYLTLRPCEDDAPPSIEDVVSALSMVGATRVSGVPTSPEEFHGDGCDSKVDIVACDNLLGDVRDASVIEPSSEEDFEVGARALSGEGLSRSGLGGMEALFWSLLASGEELSGLCATHFDLLFGDSLPAETRGLLAPSNGEVGFLEPSPDDSAADAEHLGHLVDALPRLVNLVEVGRGCDSLRADAPHLGERFDPPAAKGEAERLRVFVEYGGRLLERLGFMVKTDRLIDKGVRQYVGHVYNLQTSEGWYSANSIVTSNCFCTVTPVFTSKHWEGKEQQVGYERVYNEVVRDQDLHGEDARRAMDKYFREKQKERK